MAALPMGVYKGQANPSGVTSYNTWLGVNATSALEFVSYNNIAALHADAIYFLPYWTGTGIPLVISVPMATTDGAMTVATVASGANDATFVQLANDIVSAGYGSCTLRIGWEFNLSASLWFCGTTWAQQQTWVAAFQRIVTLMRSVPGANFKIDWCFSLVGNTPWVDYCWPGSSYVDYVGADVYAQNYLATTEPALWNAMLTRPNGLQWHANFAAALGKPISFPEWGIGSTSTHGMGDDATFMANFIAWMTANPPAHAHYWDVATDADGGWDGCVMEAASNGYPLSTALYQAAFG